MRSHRSYILRCVPVVEAGEVRAWRYTIQEAAPDVERRAFGTIQELMEFLIDESGSIRNEADSDDLLPGLH